jgi:hypothetical protein
MKDASQRIRKLVLIALMAAVTAFPISLTAAQSPNKSATDSTSLIPQSQNSDVEAMRADSKKMHVILNQMQTNLAFVTNTNDPLKPQFELEVEMWQLLLNQMDQRIEEMGRREHSPAP